MLYQVFGRVESHWIDNDIQSLSTREFRGRDKIRVGSNQNKLVSLALVSYRGNVQSKPHIDTFLANFELKISICWGEGTEIS